MSDFVKSNGGLLAVGGVVVVLFLGYLEWRVSAAVDNALSSQDIGTDAKIVAMDQMALANQRTGEENAEDIAQNRENVKAAFAALMGRPLPEDD